MELGVADQWGSQRVCKVRKRSGGGDVLRDVGDREGLAEMQVLDVSHHCWEDMGGV